MFKRLFYLLLCLSPIVVLAQDTIKEVGYNAFFPKKIYYANDLFKKGVSNLPDLLKMELGIEVENSPTFSGSRARVMDLNGKYLKILINGIPFIGREDFALNVDLGLIPLKNVDRIEIQYLLTPDNFDNSSVSGVINIISKSIDTNNLQMQVNLKESTVVQEYNLRANDTGKGKHYINGYFSYPIAKNLVFDINLARDKFQGYMDNFSGGNKTNIYDGKRGYSWSGYNKWKISPGVFYQKKNWSVSYNFTVLSQSVTVYGRSFDLHENDNESYFSVMDVDYKDKIITQNLSLKAAINKNLDIVSDLSYQTSKNTRELYNVRTDNNQKINSFGKDNLFEFNALYFKTKLKQKLISDRLVLALAIDISQTNGKIKADQSTYQTSDMDKNLLQVNQYIYMQYKVSKKILLQPLLALSHSNYGKADLLPYFSFNYQINKNNDFGVVFQTTNRRANHRELFTYLENEFNLLKGNTNLKSEKANAISIFWNNSVKQDKFVLNTYFLSKYQLLKNRIIIESAPLKIPTQEAFIYNNANRQYALYNQLAFNLSYLDYKIDLAYGLLGTKGNDISDSKTAGNFLFHSEIQSSFSWDFYKNYWLDVSYLLVTQQGFYSFERPNINQSIIKKVYNKTPSYNLVNINIGSSFFNQSLSLALRVSNLFNVNTIKYSPVDNLEHYSGDLRTQYIDYGRSFSLELKYSL